MALAVQDELALKNLAARLRMAGLPHHLIIEEDAPYTAQAMALGIAPMERKKLKKLLSGYTLLK